MESFLLSIIVVLALVVIILIKAMQAIMRFNPYFNVPYAAPPASTSAARRNNDSGAVAIISVLLLVIFLFFLSNTKIRNILDPYVPPDTEEQPSLENRDMIKDSAQSLSHWIDIQEQDDEVDEVTDLSVYHYNQPPSHDTLPNTFYAVQLEAFDWEENATLAAETWKNRLPGDSVIITLIPGPAPFKVVAGPFESRSQAKVFQQAYHKEGFIQFIDLNAQ